MASWDTVATVKAPVEQILAYTAHHLWLGARSIRLYLDDPRTTLPDCLEQHPRVTITRCDDGYWQSQGKRPEGHQGRQSRNARHAYSGTDSTWLAHLDVDEFILAERPVEQILDDVSSDVRLVKLEPFEAVHDPALAEDIFTARTFRGPLRHEFADLRKVALGEYARLMPLGTLSHAIGKVFFRTGIPGLLPRIHGAMLKGERVPASDRNPEMRLLHFHAQDREAWRAALPFRLTRGAYQFNPLLQDYLLSASAEEIDHFYLRTQTLTPEITEALADRGRIATADLRLKAKVADLLAGRLD
ncbi:MAG: glycosyltransferase family 2 protein [Tabrizicola sp.]|nr:glycosyltransferase family 2 protein [Tabrizicola sp.]